MTLNQHGHHLVSVTASSPNSITVGLKPLHGGHDHPTTVVSTFGLQRNSFPMTVDSGQGAEGMGENTLFLSMTPKLRQIMLMFEDDVYISRK